MPEETDYELHNRLIRDGYTQSSSDPNNYFKSNGNGGYIDRDTDGRYSKERSSNSSWEKDNYNSSY